MENYTETAIIDNDTYELLDIIDYQSPIRIRDSSFYFEQFLIKKNNRPKYIVALYQDGEIWSEDEIWGTKIIDLESIVRDKNDADVYIVDEIDLSFYVHKILPEIIDIIRRNSFEKNYIYGLVYDN